MSHLILLIENSTASSSNLKRNWTVSIKKKKSLLTHGDLIFLSEVIYLYSKETQNWKSSVLKSDKVLKQHIFLPSLKNVVVAGWFVAVYMYSTDDLLWWSPYTTLVELLVLHFYCVCTLYNKQYFYLYYLMHNVDHNAMMFSFKRNWVTVCAVNQLGSEKSTFWSVQ